MVITVNRWECNAPVKVVQGKVQRGFVTLFAGSISHPGFIDLKVVILTPYKKRMDILANRMLDMW